MGQLVKDVSTAFRTNKIQLIRQIKKESLALEQKILLVRSTHYIGNLEAARKSFDELVRAVEEKVTNGVLFSEGAVNELNFLLNGFNDSFLSNICDYLATGNDVLRQHIKEEAERFTKDARDFATEHEKRLIKGICQPRSSIIYLNMLDGLRGMFYNLGQITSK